MPNLTVSLDDETYRAARVAAAARGASVSALVREFLVGLSDKDARFAELAAEEAKLRAGIMDFEAEDRLPREALHRGDP